MPEGPVPACNTFQMELPVVLVRSRMGTLPLFGLAMLVHVQKAHEMTFSPRLEALYGPLAVCML